MEWGLVLIQHLHIPRYIQTIYDFIFFLFFEIYYRVCNGHYISFSCRSIMGDLMLIYVCFSFSLFATFFCISFQFCALGLISAPTMYYWRYCWTHYENMVSQLTLIIWGGWGEICVGRKWMVESIAWNTTLQNYRAWSGNFPHINHKNHPYCHLINSWNQ